MHQILNLVICIGLVLTILLYSAHALVALGQEHVRSQDPFILKAREHLLIKTPTGIVLIKNHENEH